MSLVATPRTRLWTRDEYYQMAELGFFQDQRVELLVGQIIEMSPQSSRHATVVLLVQEAVRRAFGADYVVRGQLPFLADATSEPEPDVAVVAGAIRDGLEEHPSSAVLLVEVAESSLQYDRTTKASVYAKAQIADYWIVNLLDEVIEVHRNPQPDADTVTGYAYTQVSVARRGESITPLAVPQARIAVSDLLP
jgi:Uma2 family endonuclease